MLIYIITGVIIGFFIGFEGLRSKGPAAIGALVFILFSGSYGFEYALMAVVEIWVGYMMGAGLTPETPTYFEKESERVPLTKIIQPKFEHTCLEQGYAFIYKVIGQSWVRVGYTTDPNLRVLEELQDSYGLKGDPEVLWQGTRYNEDGKKLVIDICELMVQIGFKLAPLHNSLRMYAYPFEDHGDAISFLIGAMNEGKQKYEEYPTTLIGENEIWRCGVDEYGIARMEKWNKKSWLKDQLAAEKRHRDFPQNMARFRENFKHYIDNRDEDSDK